MLPYQLFQAGYCIHCQRITLQGGRFKRIAYPALCSLIRHPTHGSVLFDTGYSQHFNDASARFPEKPYPFDCERNFLFDLLVGLMKGLFLNSTST